MKIPLNRTEDKIEEVLSEVDLVVDEAELREDRKSNLEDFRGLKNYVIVGKPECYLINQEIKKEKAGKARFIKKELEKYDFYYVYVPVSFFPDQGKIFFDFFFFLNRYRPR